MPHKGLAGAHYRYLRPNVRRQHGYSKVSERGNLNPHYATNHRNAPQMSFRAQRGKETRTWRQSVDLLACRGYPRQKIGRFRGAGTWTASLVKTTR